MKVFVWDEDLQKGSHYHIYEPISQTKLPEHYYPGFSVPEPWVDCIFWRISKMKITINNKNDVDVYSFHDCDFKEMNYQYLEERIRFLLFDRYEKKIYSLCFEKVIYYDMQSFHMWINMPTDIHEWGLCENEIFDKLHNFYETQKMKWGHTQPMLKLTEYIGVTFEFVSGDELTIICKSIEIVEQDMGN